MRISIMDTKDRISVDILARNIGILVDATLKYYYGVEPQVTPTFLIVLPGQGLIQVKLNAALWYLSNFANLGAQG